MKSKLKTIIDSAIVDGVITKDERKIIIEEALNEGYTEEQIELVINARLQDFKQKKKDKDAKEMKPGCFSKLKKITSYFILLMINTFFFVISFKWGLMMHIIFDPLWCFFYHKSTEAIVSRRMKYTHSTYDFYVEKVNYANKKTYFYMFIYLIVFFFVATISECEMANELFELSEFPNGSTSKQPS